MTPENQRDEDLRKAIENLDDLFYKAFGTNDSPTTDWVMFKFKLSSLEKEKAGLEERVRELAEREQMHSDLRRENLDAHIECERNRIEELTRLKARNEELEAELQATRKACDQAHQNTLDRDEEISRLKAENERLAKESERRKFLLKECEKESKFRGEEIAHLKESRSKWAKQSSENADEVDRLTSALAMAMEIIRKILKQCYLAPVDHACIECVPAGSSVVKGFLCGVHEGVKALSDPSGSLAFERWKKMGAVVEAAKIVVPGLLTQDKPDVKTLQALLEKEGSGNVYINQDGSITASPEMEVLRQAIKELESLDAKGDGNV